MDSSMWSRRVVALTGAGSGIGRALSLALAARGAKLALSDANEASVRETADRCRRDYSVEVRSYGVDVTSRDAMASYLAAIQADFGRVNAIINNAGVSLTAMVTEQSFDDIDWVLGVNLQGVMNGTQLFLPALIESGDGVIVNISSLFGIIGVPGQSAYNASKFAVRGYTEALAMEMAVQGHPVSVHCVHPGGVKTNIVRASRIHRKAAHDALVRRFDRIAKTSPEAAAECILRGVERRRVRILVGADAKWLDIMSRVLGSGYQRLVAKQAKRLYPRE